MKEFEIISNGGVMADHIRIPPQFEPIINDLFDGRVFDMDTAAVVIPCIDDAKAKLQADPDRYRQHLEGLGLRQVRQMLDSMRDILVTFPDATVSGLVEP
ncbi:hypothetical protein SAMN05421776_11748 [Nocardia farcinica]|uniref:Uncharacterized protein n=1 Tax=Nocardia farcinica TaxID=37329 RepID=A0A0H5NXN5_NOCFR|nr:hypothetical protein [Nocardia farcinica]AXK86603.1 hypothetical protein DXT66_14090 [Nocardia farcinica]PFW99055.1 hypothetical protein CJ469_05655 [Nocardia farcinica]PFX06093.1 hypothetical protein CJ468_04953 [Nocardia farcinica]CRY79804.1 Uncharacterised protein [Nocardia farcinica]CRY79896.1 Uncharacterised protein [Nocardia farcinica]